MSLHVPSAQSPRAVDAVRRASIGPSRIVHVSTKHQQRTHRPSRISISTLVPTTTASHAGAHTTRRTRVTASPAQQPVVKAPRSDEPTTTLPPTHTHASDIDLRCGPTICATYRLHAADHATRGVTDDKPPTHRTTVVNPSSPVDPLTQKMHTQYTQSDSSSTTRTCRTATCTVNNEHDAERGCDERATSVSINDVHMRCVAKAYLARTPCRHCLLYTSPSPRDRG